MPTDVKLLTIEDLCRELGVVYRDAGRRRKEIVAEIARRISVRDRVVRQFMCDGTWRQIGFQHGTTVEADADYNPTYYDENGEQIL